MTAALALRGIDKRFGVTTALTAAHCTIRRGTVHALLGENGAGKTTLMRIAFGLLRADAGELEVEGRAVRFRSSADAIAAGIGMVHQHFMLIPAMTVAENVALGGRGRFDARAAAARVRTIGAETGLHLDPDTPVRELAVGAQQRLEIIKALAHDARILILDEPTAVLAPGEAADLYAWLRRFSVRGGSAVLITHKLREALAVADDVTVLRGGRTVLESTTAAAPEDEIIAALVGERTLPPELAGEVIGAASAVRARRDAGEAPVLSLRGVGYTDPAGVVRLRDVTLEVRPGEVLGVLGVEGAGQRELLRLLAGRLEPTTGTVQRPARVGFIPEDRLQDAVIAEMSLTENLALAGAGERRGRVRWPALREQARSVVEELEVRASGVDAPMRALSGGNQQKFIVGRERAHAAGALVAENPTRGLDIRATARVRAEISAPAGNGRAGARAVVYYSSDIEEVLAVATRVVVCHAGLVREVAPGAEPGDLSPYARALVGAEL